MASLLSTRPAAASIVSRSALLGLFREQPHRGGFKPETDSRSFRSRPKYGAQSPFCSLSVALTVFCRLCFSFPPFLSVPVCLPARLAVCADCLSLTLCPSLLPSISVSLCALHAKQSSALAGRGPRCTHGVGDGAAPPQPGYGGPSEAGNLKASRVRTSFCGFLVKEFHLG